MSSYLAGIRKTDRLHLGHYFAFIKPIVDLLQTNEDVEITILYCDLYEPSTKMYQEAKEDFLKFQEFILKFLPKGSYTRVYNRVTGKVTIVQQSSKQEELYERVVKLQHVVPVGYLERMTQYKEKSENKESVPTSLLTYPLLMTADLLTFPTEYVIVGKDQTQHINYANDFIKKYRVFYGPPLEEIESDNSRKIYLNEGISIRDIKRPNVKMSKSSESDSGTIWLDESKEDLTKKVTGACTSDMGIHNLLLIHNLLSKEEKLTFTYAKDNCTKLKQGIIDLVLKFVINI